MCVYGEGDLTHMLFAVAEFETDARLTSLNELH